MPNIKSAKKRVNVNAKKQLENKMLKSKLATSIKKFKTAVSTGAENLEQEYSAVVSLIDSLASKGIMHANNANRKKARLAKFMTKSKTEVA